MSTPYELYLEAARRGLRLEPRGGMLAVIPAGKVSPDFADVLREHKRELLDWLETRAVPLTPDSLPWLHVARQVLAGEFEGADKSTRESITIGLRGVPHPLCQQALALLGHHPADQKTRHDHHHDQHHHNHLPRHPAGGNQRNTVRTKAEILADPMLSAFERAQLFRELDALPPEQPKPISLEDADELRTLASAITAAVKSLSDFDAMDTANREALSAIRAEIAAAESPAQWPTRENGGELAGLRGQRDLASGFLGSQATRRQPLLANFKGAVKRLAARLREVTGRSMGREFENPNTPPTEAARQAGHEVERVLRNEQDDFERMNGITW